MVVGGMAFGTVVERRRRCVYVPSSRSSFVRPEVNSKRICSNWAQSRDRQAKTLDSHALLVAALMVAKSRSRQTFTTAQGQTSEVGRQKPKQLKIKKQKI
uniref:Uncharacterized protein n=1 Tax=Rhodnius prolixus TaxID=13249 RepID=T1HQA9_RHOPR